LKVECSPIVFGEVLHEEITLYRQSDHPADPTATVGQQDDLDEHGRIKSARTIGIVSITSIEDCRDKSAVLNVF
jgi:hypothetical protein